MKILILLSASMLIAHMANSQVKTDFNNPNGIDETGKFGKPFPKKTPHTILLKLNYWSLETFRCGWNLCISKE